METVTQNRIGEGVCLQERAFYSNVLIKVTTQSDAIQLAKWAGANGFINNVNKRLLNEDNYIGGSFIDGKVALCSLSGKFDIDNKYIKGLATLCTEDSHNTQFVVTVNDFLSAPESMFARYIDNDKIRNKNILQLREADTTDDLIVISTAKPSFIAKMIMKNKAGNTDIQVITKTEEERTAMILWLAKYEFYHYRMEGYPPYIWKDSDSSCHKYTKSGIDCIFSFDRGERHGNAYISAAKSKEYPKHPINVRDFLKDPARWLGSVNHPDVAWERGAMIFVFAIISLILYGFNWIVDDATGGTASLLDILWALPWLPALLLLALK